LAIGKVLDCGAGEGAVLQHLNDDGRFAELHAVDISDSGIEQIRKRALPLLRSLQKFDGYVLPFDDGAFDLAYATHVIEHVEHPRILLRELARVSKHQVFEVPLDYRLGIDTEVKGQLAIGHINIYTPALFRFLLLSEGFELLDERLTRLAPEVIRYNWRHNERRKVGFRDEARLRLAPLRAWWRRLSRGRRTFDEYEFDALTVLTRAAGKLDIM
jgi:SAM-dependent methyltransferase